MPVGTIAGEPSQTIPRPGLIIPLLIEIFHFLATFARIQPLFSAIAGFDGRKVFSAELFIDAEKIFSEHLCALCPRGYYAPGGLGQRLFPCLELSIARPGRQRRIPLPKCAPI